MRAMKAMKAMKAAMKRRDRTDEYRKRNEKRARDGRKGRVRTDGRRGRVRVRTDGRVRKGRVEKREQKFLRCLNVQRPWARLLVTGAKTVEVRKYQLKNYQHEDFHVGGPRRARE